MSKFLKEKLEAADFDKINHDYLFNICNEFSKSRPKHKGVNREWDTCWINYPVLATDFKTKVGIIHGQYKAYRNDHPMSPDGFAMLGISFSLSFVRHEDTEVYENLVEIFDY